MQGHFNSLGVQSINDYATDAALDHASRVSR